MILKSVNFEDQMSSTKAKTGAGKYYTQQIGNSFSKFSTFFYKKYLYCRKEISRDLKNAKLHCLICFEKIQ